MQRLRHRILPPFLDDFPSFQQMQTRCKKGGFGLKRSFTICCAALALALSGCGGGGGASGGSSASNPPLTAPFTLGSVTGFAASTNPPVTTAAQGTVATGLTGTITQLKVREQNLDLSDTRIAYASPITGSGDVYTANPDGTNPMRITKTDTVSEENPAISPAGNKIACQGAGTDFLRHITLYRSDGVFLAQVSPTGTSFQENYVCWSPDSSKLLYQQSFNGPTHLVQYTISGAVTTPIDTGGDAEEPAWSSRNQLAFVTGRNAGSDIYTSNADGSSPTEASTGDQCDSPAWSPDGYTLYYIDHTAVPDNRIIAFHKFFWGSNTATLFTTTDSISELHATPDGQWVAFQDSSTSSIQKVSAGGGSASTVCTPPIGTNGFSWGPMIADRLVVGTGGLLATTASGFIYADFGGHTQSVLAFNAVTPSSCIIRAMTGIGGGEDSLVFTVDADTLNLIQYANNPVWIAQPVVLGGTSTPTANGAVISIGAFDGKVNAVLPFNGSRAVGSRPSVTRSGSNYVFSGQFVGAYNGAGNNVAPSGAATVTLDPKTGTLTAS